MKTELYDLLKDTNTALLDWLHTHAQELCSKHDVDMSWARIEGNGGTLAYIAKLRARLKVAIEEEDKKFPIHGVTDRQLNELYNDVETHNGKHYWRFDEQQADPIHKMVTPDQVIEEMFLRKQF